MKTLVVIAEHPGLAEAIRAVRPFGVDVSSGVEEKPGLKSASKINRFVDAARQEYTS